MQTKLKYKTQSQQKKKSKQSGRREEQLRPNPHNTIKT